MYAILRKIYNFKTREESIVTVAIYSLTQTLHIYKSHSAEFLGKKETVFYIFAGLAFTYVRVATFILTACLSP